MHPVAPQAAPTDVFWYLRSYDLRQRVEPDGSFWFDNRGREKKGVVILQYTQGGRMLYRDRHGQREAPAGWATLFSLGEESAYGVPRELGETFHTQYVSLDGAGLLQHWNLIRARYGSVFYMGEDNPLLESMRQLCRRPAPKSAAELILASADVYGFVMRLYTYLDDLWSREKAPVERAMEELLRHASSPASLKEVAQRHGCSREHLTRVFARRVGVPPATWLARARLAKALELLRETRLPVARVAQQCGFSSKHTLARRVRAETGVPPGQYRRTYARRRR